MVGVLLQEFRALFQKQSLAIYGPAANYNLEGEDE